MVDVIEFNGKQKLIFLSLQCQERQLPEGQAESQLLEGGEENSDSQHHKPDPGTVPLLLCGLGRTL